MGLGFAEAALAVCCARLAQGGRGQAGMSLLNLRSKTQESILDVGQVGPSG